jgi:hypothetical protein
MRILGIRIRIPNTAVTDKCVFQWTTQYISDLQYARIDPRKYSFAMRKVESRNGMPENMK